MALRLIHALRNGLVRGEIVEQVLQFVADAANAKVAWLYPDRPVLPAKFNQIPCNLDKPASADQISCSIKKVGLVSNVLTPMTCHALRRGAAQDIAHLPSTKDGAGLVLNEVRQSLGHTAVAFNKGTNQTYTGHATREFYNDRIGQQCINPSEVKIQRHISHRLD